MLVVDGELVELLGATVALGGEELDVGLRGSQTHGVAALPARRVLPELRVG